MTLRSTLVTAASVLALTTASAFAADLPSKKEAPAFNPAPVFTWTGFYVGLNAGAAFGGNRGGITPTGNFGNAALFPAANLGALAAIGNGNNGNGARFTGGGQIGYNYQIGSFVMGIETDLNFIASSNGSGNAVVLPVALGGPGNTTVTFARGSNNKWFGTLRPRLGFAVDRALFYVTGGLSYGGGNGSGSVTIANAAGPTAIFTSNGGGNKVGYVLGGGIEYAVTNNWIMRGEYLYIGRSGGGRTYVAPVAAPGFGFSTGGNGGFSVIRAAVNYKF